jgi:hypothetical protein
MPRIPFATLPSDARLWVFAADRPLEEAESAELLHAVDGFLDRWAAHGQPLSSARDWRLRRFLAVAVDQRDANASGCSIDGLYRLLKVAEQRLGTSFLRGGRVFYADPDGSVLSVDRAEFSVRAERGEVGPETTVYDLTVATKADWKERFQRAAAETWHRELIPAG